MHKINTSNKQQEEEKIEQEKIDSEEQGRQ